MAKRIGSAGELARRQRGQQAAPPLPTACAALDRLLGGGLFRGELVELVGRRSSGRFALVLSALAAATTVGEAAVLVDLGDSLDPRLARAAGIDLSRLLWLRPRTVKEALIGAETAIGGGFPLVAIDLGNPPVPGGRGADGMWLRLTRAADEGESALLLSAPYRASGPAAAAVLTCRRARPRWKGRGAQPRLLDGLDGRLVIDKRRGRAPGESEPLRIHSPLALPSLPARTQPARPEAPRRTSRPGRRAPAAPPAARELASPLPAAASA